MPQPEAYVYASGSPWKFGGLTGKQFVKRAWHELIADDVLGRAAQLAYFFLFSLFPLGIFLGALIGALAGTHSHLAYRLTREIMHFVPPSANDLVRETIRHSLAGTGNGKLAFGIVVALFSASSGMSAMMDTLNTVFDVRESRSLKKRQGVALLLTIALGILICIAILLIVLGGKIAGAIAGGAFDTVWDALLYPVSIFFLLVSFSMVYRYAPDMNGGRWRLFTPGAVTGLCLWIGVSFGLRIYLHHFNSYSDYGTIGAVMVLMLWFYGTGLAFLIGGEVDALIDRADTGREKHGRSGPASDVTRRASRQRAAREGAA